MFYFWLTAAQHMELFHVLSSCLCWAGLYEDSEESEEVGSPPPSTEGLHLSLITE